MTTQVQDETKETEETRGNELSSTERLEQRINKGGPPALYTTILDWFCTYSVRGPTFDRKRWLSKRITRHVKTNEDALRKARQAVASLGHPLNVFLTGNALLARKALGDNEYVGCGFVFYPAKNERGEAILSRNREFMPVVNEHGYPVIARVVPDSPADRIGFRPGDAVVSIDGRSTRHRSVDSLTDQVDSCPGKIVRVRRASDRHPLPIVQATTPVPVASARFGNVGYIRISTFLPEDMPFQVQAALTKLDDCEAIVIDVRGSPGGSATVNVKALSLFIESGEVLKLSSDNDKPFEIIYILDSASLIITRSDGQPHEQVLPRLPYLLRHRPLFVLVDGNTRSAPEGFSQAVRDYKVATLVGSRTFGKGVVQGKISVLEYVCIEALYGRWTSPQGVWIGDGGVTVSSGIVPDVVVFGDEGDRVLETALELATKELANKR